MILVSGYYGYQNSGDEGILAALCHDLESIGIERRRIVVLSGNPTATEKLHKVNAVSRYRLSKIIALMSKAKLLVSGGGSLLQDSTSWRTIPYYLGIIELAIRRDVPVVMYAQGIGPVQSLPFQRWVRRIVGKVSKLSVRDEASSHLLHNWGVTRTDLFVSSDPVFGFTPRELPRNDYNLGITFNLRPYDHWNKHYSQWCKLVKIWIDEYNWPVNFVSLHPDDFKMGQQLHQAVPDMRLFKPKDWLDACILMSQTKVALTMRLHGMIFASIGGTIPVGIAYDPKIKAIGSQLKVPIKEPVPGENLSQLLGTLIENFECESQHLAKKITCLKESTLINRQILADSILD